MQNKGSPGEVIITIRDAKAVDYNEVEKIVSLKFDANIKTINPELIHLINEYFEDDETLVEETITNMEKSNLLKILKNMIQLKSIHNL